MNKLLDMLDVSFTGLESYCFKQMQEYFTQVLVEVLEQLDELIWASRDEKRFVVKDWRARTVDTLMGPVTFKRRYYHDREQGTYGALLDEQLGLAKQERVSPGLTMAAVFQATLGPSYRAARDSLSRFFDHQALSHEGIRQLVLATGKEIAQDQQQRRDDPQGEREVPLLFLEVDGLNISLQKAKTKRRELPLMLSHEGWADEGSGRELVECHYYGQTSIKDFWEEASRHLCSQYRLDENTLVVINGDRASWIREGVEYFPRAIYQADVFHVQRDLREYIRDPVTRQAALEAYRQNQPKELKRLLGEAAEEEPEGSRKDGLEGLARDVGDIPESFQDYRWRLQKRGYDVTELHGLGASESLVKRFAYRLKNRGQSWRVASVGGMLQSLVQRLEGKLAHYAEQVERLKQSLDDGRIRAGAGRIVKQATEYAVGAHAGRMPVRDVGRNRSGGLSRMMRKLNHAGIPVT